MRIQTRYCTDCALWIDGICRKGHIPRFYGPRTPVDTNYGWKRACLDFIRLPETETVITPNRRGAAVK